MTKQATKAQQQPAQAEHSEYRGSSQPSARVAVITGGDSVPLQRAGQPAEVAPRYVVPGFRRCLIHDGTNAAS